MILDDDIDIKKSIADNAIAYKKLKRNIKSYICYYFSQHHQYPDHLLFVNDDDSFWIYPQISPEQLLLVYYKEKINREFVFNLTDDIYEKTIDHAQSHDLNISNFKIDYTNAKW